MLRVELEANLTTTLNDLNQQTGLETSDRTGVCNLVVLGAFTGARLDYNRIPDTLEGQIALEQRHGLVRASVHYSGALVLDTIKTVLQQEEVPFHGLLAESRIETGGRYPSVVPHAIAVAVDENRRPFGVVDSLIRGGLRQINGESLKDDVLDAGLYVLGRFLPRRPNLSLVLDETGRSALKTPGRLFYLKDYIAVSMMPPVQPR